MTADDEAEVSGLLVSVLGARGAGAVRLAGGTRSIAYRVRGGVIRFSRRPDAARRFANERAALAVVAGRSAVACPVIVDYGGAEAWCWQLTTAIAGPSVASLWPGATAAERDRLVQLAAQLLADLHRIELTSFGDLVGPGHASAGAALAARLAAARQTALANGRFTGDEFDVFAALAIELTTALPPAVCQLRHGDFHLGNLIAAGRNIAVVDFEWASGGRGVDDLAIGDYQDELCPGSAAALAADYRVRAGIDRNGFDRMLDAVRLTWKLVQSATRNNAAVAARNRAELAAFSRLHGFRSPT